MKKLILLTALVLSAVSAGAEGIKNAVCVAKTDGSMQYVALNSEVELTTNPDAFLQVMSGNKVVFEVKLPEVKEITTTEHDFSTTGIKDVEQVVEGPVEIYDLTGKKVTNVTPGQVYILKKGSTTKKVIR